MDEMFKNICEECSLEFETDDLNATLCLECWEKIVGAELENEGE